MVILPHHFSCDHTQLWDFSKLKHEFLEKIFIWPFELIHLGGFLLPFAFQFDFLLIFFDECKVTYILAHYLIEGSDRTTSSSRPTKQPRYSTTYARPSQHSTSTKSNSTRRSAHS